MSDIECSSNDIFCQARSLFQKAQALSEQVPQTRSFLGNLRIEEIEEPLIVNLNTSVRATAQAAANKHPDKNVVVISKSSHELYLFRNVNGQQEIVDLVEVEAAKVDPLYAKRCKKDACKKKVALYFPAPVSLGYNLGPKKKAGDQKTPVGTYKICDPKSGGKFVASVHINYPNYEDIERAYKDGRIKQYHYENIKTYLDKGFCPPHSPLGSLLKIHGSYKKDEETVSLEAEHDPDWQFITYKDQTFGCIGIENYHMYYLRSVLQKDDVVVILP